MKNHVMIDLETLGTDLTTAPVIQIAAIRFDIETGMEVESLIENINLSESLYNGGIIESSTLKWWLNIDSEYLISILNSENQISEFDMLIKLTSFIKNDDYVWANSPRFDLGILQSLYKRYNLSIPWNYQNEMDVRTLNNSIGKQLDKPTHSAFNDCLGQIKLVTNYFKKYKHEFTSN